MVNARIARVESATLVGVRPREAGNNSRLNIHGIEVTLPLARLTTDDGRSGFGFSQAGREEAQAILGTAVSDLLTGDSGAAETARVFDFPLWICWASFKANRCMSWSRQRRRKHLSRCACRVMIRRST